jgi:TrmH family RNA methyltransferase
MITSSANARVRAARKLMERKERHRRRQLLVEGVRLVSDAWAQGVRPTLVFYDPELLGRVADGLALVDTLTGAGCECLACSPPVFSTLAETVTPQGIAAVLPLPELPLPGTISLALILDGVRDPGNAGTLIRSAAAADVDVVIFGPGAVDPFNEKVVRSGMGAHFRVALRVLGNWEDIRRILGASLPIYLAAAGAGRTYDQIDWRGAAALLVGGEAAGASAEARRQAMPLHIPMARNVESLNAGVAGSIILFEAARQRRTR